MGHKYRAAIIGTGRMGGLMEDEIPPEKFTKPYSHFSAYAAIDEVEVVAVANRSAERMKRFSQRFSFTNTYLDYRTMIEKEKPDIVSVTTPSVARAEPIIFAAEHGVRGIYAEKGLCASLAEADRIRSALKANGVAFNWGAMRRHHDGYKRLRAAIERGDIGDPQFVIMYAQTDLIKHHPHTLDLVAMMLGDPVPEWVEGRLAEPEDPADPPTQQFPRYDATGHRFVPPPNGEIADPMVGYYRVRYLGGAEGYFVPRQGFNLDVWGTDGHAHSWDNEEMLCLRRSQNDEVKQTTIRPRGNSPTICTIRDIMRELETGEPTAGRIDITMQTVEVQFGIAHSHLQEGARVVLPVTDRSLYIPGG